MVDLQLLFSLYEIHSPSGSEKRMRKHIKKMCYEFGATKVEQDKVGNLLVTKGDAETYPCIVSHIDQVQKKHSKDFRVFRNGAVVFGYSGKSMEQQGLGADDKNGIYVCLECLRRYDNVKCAFFVGEETGCVGSSAVDLEFFKDCRFILQCDRRNAHDLITSIMGTLCSDEFLKDIDYKNYGYKEEDGLSTDVGELVERGVGISCVNMSCGYYHPHTDNECTDITELDNCKEFVFHIFDKCTEVYKHETEYHGYGRHRGYGYGWDDYDYPGGRYNKKSKVSGFCYNTSKNNSLPIKKSTLTSLAVTPSETKSIDGNDEPLSYTLADGRKIWRWSNGEYIDDSLMRYKIDHEHKMVTSMWRDNPSNSQGETIADADYSVIHEYDSAAERKDEYENYFEDYNLMRDLIQENWYGESFDMIYQSYSDQFTCNDIAYLSDIYNDAYEDVCNEERFMWNN